MADVVISEKQCKRCGESKPISEFGNHKTTRDRKRPDCKVCQRAYHKAYSEQNSERLRVQKCEYRRKNVAKIGETVKAWRARNRDRYLSVCREYASKNSDKLREKAKEWYWNNRDRSLASSKAYRAEKGDSLREWDRGRSRSEQRRQRNRQRYLVNRAARLERYRTDAKKRLHSLMSCSIRQSLKGTKNCRSWMELVPYTVEELRSHLLKTMPSGYTWNDFMSGILHLDHIIPQSVFNFSEASDIDFKLCWDIRNLQLLPGPENIRKGAHLAKPFQPSLTGI